jgi:predicted metal-dependent peptidase
MSKASFSNLGVFLGAIQNKKLKSKGGMGADLAKVEMERKNVLDLNIVVGIDVSGSINASMFKDFMTQLNQIKGMSRIKVVEVGDKIEAVYDFTKPSSRVARLGGGGGNGEQIFFPMAKKMKPDAILYMTDGFCMPASDPGIPVGVILTAQGHQPYPWCSTVGRLPH